MGLLHEISEELELGHAVLVKEKVLAAMEAGYMPDQVLKEGLLAGLERIGKQFRESEVGIPEVLLAARAMNTGIRVLKPFYGQEKRETRGKICVGTVQGDIHDIGKNLVKLMMECQGFEIIDLGNDVAPERFVEASQEHHCSLICCSALLSTTMNELKAVIKAFEKAGLRPQVKIMIGGAPVTQQFCEKIGADCYTEDAMEASQYAVWYDEGKK